MNNWFNPFEGIGSGGGAQITVDTQVTEGSTNPVQNGAIYNFVNSSVATNTAYFIGTFNSVQDLENYSGDVSNNDYAFVISTDSAGNTVYNRYKYSSDTEQWSFEYALNNSSFTANQWDTINSTFTQITPAEVRSLWAGEEVALIPIMTSASDTTGSVSYGNYYGSGGYGVQNPWLPFDGNDSTCLYYMNENVTDGWLQYEFNTPKLVTTIKALFGNYLASNSVSAKLYVYDVNNTEIEKNTVTVTGWSDGTYGEYVFPVNMTISKFKFVFGYKTDATNVMTYTVQAYALAT